jgi:ribosome recycling factor
MNTIAEVRKNTEQKMTRSLDALKADLGKVRTGRAHAGLLDHIMVDYYGSAMPIPKIANVSVLDARSLGVSPWEKKMLGAIEKAIRDSNLGLNPASQGDMVRVPMPALTEERRHELIKIIKHDGENAKVAVRNQRRDAIHALKELLKSKAVSEDEERRAQEEVQKLTDRNVADIDQMIAGKEIELMAV